MSVLGAVSCSRVFERVSDSTGSKVMRRCDGTEWRVSRWWTGDEGESVLGEGGGEYAH